MSSLTVKLDTTALEALDDFVQRTGRSRESVVAQAIEAYVAHRDWQLSKIEAGLKAADEGDFSSDAEVERVKAKFATPA